MRNPCIGCRYANNCSHLEESAPGCEAYDQYKRQLDGVRVETCPVCHGRGWTRDDAGIELNRRDFCETCDGTGRV